ncbi:MAG TPA: hypothetical protein PLF01_02055, partial [Alphaproteobacteria bacterium]|nr:hypothetical protein [Alphaproteobacteria bacterium]
IAIPTPILYKDKDGKEVMRLDIGSQEMGGLWSGKLENFSKLSATYSDIKLSHFKKQEVLTIAKVMTATDLKQDKQGKWSGPAKINIVDFKIAKPDGIKIIGAKEAASIMEITGFLPSQKQSTDEDDSDLPFIDMLKNLGEKLSLQASVKGLILNSADIPMVKTKGLSFDNFDMAFSADGLQQGKISQLLQLSYNGLKTKGGEEDALLPDHANINMSLTNLPLKDILDVAAKIIPADQDNPAAKQVAALQAMITLPKMLSDAGTIMTLSKSGYGNEIYSASLDGTVKANPKSPFGATGELNFGMDDIDATIKKLENKENQKENLLKLNAIKEVCGKKADKKGSSIKCRITLDESANLSVNDQDIKFLINALSGKTADTKPEDTTAPH